MPKDGKTAGMARPYNDRLFLDLIRTNGQMSKAELTRASGLSAQSATVIVNRLVQDRLLKPGEAVKGKVGQPSTPYSLNPNGAISIGVKVGRRSLEVASMSLDYSILKRLVLPYDFPKFTSIRQNVLDSIEILIAEMTSFQSERIVGIGIALPDDLSAWESTVGAPVGAMADWSNANLEADVAAEFDLPVETLNDASAACLAEIAVGNSNAYGCFAYFYVGTFIGGGIAIGEKLFQGHQNLAGAIASLPTGVSKSPQAAQLLEGASLHYLEESARKRGLSLDEFYSSASLDPEAQDIFADWLVIAAPQIAFAAVSAQTFLDPEAIIIDSSLTPELTAQIIDAVGSAIETNYDHRGLATINLVPGETGISARAIGSSIAPFLSEFALDVECLFPNKFSICSRCRVAMSALSFLVFEVTLPRSITIYLHLSPALGEF